MKNIYFTPGPAQLYPTVEKHIAEAMEQQICSISHRSTQFEDIFSSTVSGLKQLLGIPQDYTIFFVSSGTEAMERTIQNVVEEKSFHFVNGSFSKRLYETALELGKHPEKIEVPLGEGFEFLKDKGVAWLEGILATRSPQGMPAAGRALTEGKAMTGPQFNNVELICFTHNETSTGVMIPEKDIHAVAKTYPDKLIAVDIVSSVPYPNLDYKLLDIIFFSVQKGFGLPAGLGVMIVSPRAIERSLYLQKKGITIGTYHNFPTLKKWADKNQTPETPPVLEIFLFEAVLKDFLKIGIETLRRQTDEKAQLLYDFFDNHPTWSSAVKDNTFRSQTVIVATIGNGQKQLKEYLKNNRMIVGSGYGTQKDIQIRIANFPALSKQTIEKLLEFLHNYK